MRETPIWRRYQRLLGSDPSRDVEEELSFHLGMRVQDLIAHGVPAGDARARAEREFGNFPRIRDEMNDIGRDRLRRQRRARWWDSLVQDLRFAGRTLRKSPGFASVAILTLGLGIGGATALFSVVEGVLLRPLPYSEPDRIVQLWQAGAQGGRSSFSDPNFKDVAERVRSFEAIAAYRNRVMPVSAGGQVSRVAVSEVSGGFFDVLGLQPALGRAILPDEFASGAPVAIVDQEFWRAELGGDPNFADQAVRIGDGIYSVVGVLPQGLEFPWGSGAWVPRDPQAVAYRTGHNWQVVGRLRDGVDVQTARAELSGIAAELKALYGDDTAMADAVAIPLQEQLVGWIRPALLVLLAAAGFLLLIACANVVNLLLARAASRRGEIAIRQAMGAGMGRLTRQFLTESLVLSVAGGVIGVMLAKFGVDALLALEPGRLPRVDEVKLNGVVLAFAFGVSVVAAAALGLLSSVRASDTDVREMLAESARSEVGGRRSYRMRSALMALQVAMTLVLLVGAGLLARSFTTLSAVDPGYRTSGAVVVDAFLPTDRLFEQGPVSGDLEPGLQQIARTRDDLLDRLGAIPGVTRVGVTSSVPLNGGGSNGTFLVLARPDEAMEIEAFETIMKDPSRSGQATYRAASTDYFRAMGIPLVRGRLFDDRDGPASPHAAVISESLAEQRWPGEDPIGKLIQYGNMDGDLRPFVIVGIVADVRELGLDVEPRPTFYANALQRSASLAGSFSLVLETSGDDAASLVPLAHAAAREAVPNVPVRIRTLEEIYSTSLAQRRFSLLLLGAFAMTALVLAVTGIYGVISYLVAQRNREWGIRLALGATRGDVMWQVFAGGMTLIAGGVVIGMAIALGATRFLESFLYGVTATDPITFAGVALLLVAVSLLASYLPASRATRVDPMVAMRE